MQDSSRSYNPATPLDDKGIYLRDGIFTCCAIAGSADPSSVPNLYRGILCEKEESDSSHTIAIFSINVLMLLTIPGCNLSPRCL